MRHWKLQNQVLLLVAFLIAVMLGILVFDAFQRVQTNRINDAAQTQAMADVIAGRLDQLSTDSRGLLTVLADLPVLQRLDQLSCTAIADELDVRSSLYADAALFNRAGDLVCSTVPVERAAGVSAARLDWFRTTVSGRGFHISEPFVDPISGTWVVMFSGPVYDPQGRFAGVLGLPVDLEVLGSNLAPYIRPRGQTLTVLNASGRVVVREPDPDKWLGKDAIGAGFFADQRSGAEGVLEDVGLDGVRRYYGRQMGAVAGWQVLVGVPVEYVQAPAEGQLRRGLGVILAATLVAVALATVATRRILRPLHLLVAGIGSNASEAQLRSAIGMGPPEIRSLAAELVRSIESKYKARQRELVLAKVFESANEVIFVTDADNMITAVNHAFETITGYPEAEALGRDPRMLGSGRHDRAFYRELWTALETSGGWQGEMWNRRKSGEVFPAIQAISRVHGESGEVCYVAVMLDISRQKEIEQELEHLAQHDPLTGLPNRGVLLSRLEMALARNQRLHQHLAVLSLDVDAFKDVNDTLGHRAGDDLLVQVAQRLETCFDAGETVCRMGGDEFMVIIEGLPHSDALVQVIVRIHEAMRPPFRLAAREISITMSLGISLHPDHADTVTELISFADAAAHRGKQRGRGGYAFYTGDMTREAERRLSLEHDLRRALTRGGELFLVYQPQLSLRDGSTVGGEALIRWNHPVLGMLLPTEFIPLAEQTGHIEQITRWVVDEVCAQIVRWRSRSLRVPVVAINLSGQNLGSDTFAVFLQERLARHGLTPDCIDLEITEGTLIGNPESACREIEQLRALGCRISIDDFGTGYSSLSYLKQFNADVLKIDRSFVTGVDQDASNQGIARAVIAVGHALKMEVMAEGVERPAERQWLMDAGCDLVQGYLLCRPIPADEFIEFVQAPGNRRPLADE